jgi:hypothetical protein
MEWVARLWNLRPEKFDRRPMPETIPSDLGALLASVTKVYLPYLRANEAAYEAGRAKVSYAVQGVTFDEPTKPYRVRCRHVLHDALMALSDADRDAVRAVLADDAAFETLSAPPVARVPDAFGALPIKPVADRAERRPVDSWWRRR